MIERDIPAAPLDYHPGLAGKLAGLKASIATSVTEAFLARHPDWLARYGDRARLRGVEDACFHIDFLAGALESQAVTPFEGYVRWTARVLAARGISPVFVAENLRQIDAALAPHLTPEEHRDAAIVLAAGRAVCEVPPAAEAAASVQPGDPTAHDTFLRASQMVFLQTILAGKRREALTVALEALRAGHSALEIYTEVFQASLYRVGQLWETNQITVAEEHMATAITQHVIAQLYRHLSIAEPTRGRIVLTGVQGELHHVGANMVADVLEADGWDVRFLGTNMPHSGILQALDDHKADILGISATLLAHMPQVRALIAEVDARFGPRGPRIVVGGQAFRVLGVAPADLGVSGIAGDLRTASGAMQAAAAERRAS